MIVSIHSYRGGTGKSNLTANLAYLLTASGKRVAVVDTDIQSPGIHIIFNVEQKKLNYCLNDFLWRKCSLPHDDDLMVLGSKNLFTRVFPGHKITGRLEKLCDFLVASDA